MHQVLFLGISFLSSFSRGFLLSFNLLGFLFWWFSFLFRWGVVDVLRLLRGRKVVPDVERMQDFAVSPNPKFPTPYIKSLPISPMHSASSDACLFTTETCSWLNTFLHELYFRLDDGELINSTREAIAQKLREKLALISSDYRAFVGKLQICDFSLRSIPLITAVRCRTANGLNKDVAIVFDVEFHGGIGCTISSRDTVLGSCKVQARFDYYKTSIVLHETSDRSESERCVILSASDAPCITVSLGFGKHNMKSVAKIIERIFNGRVNEFFVFPNHYKYLIRKTHLGFQNTLFKVNWEGSIPAASAGYYIIRVARARNLVTAQEPTEADWKGVFATIAYGDKIWKTSVGKSPRGRPLGFQSPVWQTTFHFSPKSDRPATVKITLSQKHRKSKAVKVLYQFDLSLALFTQTSQRLRLRMDGSAVLSEMPFSERSKSTYISLDVLYYKNDVSLLQRQLQDISLFLFGKPVLQAGSESAQFVEKRKKRSLFSLLTGKKPHSSSTEKRPDQAGQASGRSSKVTISPDLSTFLDGKSSPKPSPTQKNMPECNSPPPSNALPFGNLPILRTMFREKVSGLSKFWSQQQELILGSKNSQTQMLTLSDVTRSLTILFERAAVLLQRCSTCTQEHSVVSSEQQNDFYESIDEVSYLVQEANRFILDRSVKQFRITAQLCDYIRELAILLGQMRSAFFSITATELLDGSVATDFDDATDSDGKTIGSIELSTQFTKTSDFEEYPLVTLSCETGIDDAEKKPAAMQSVDSVFLEDQSFSVYPSSLLLSSPAVPAPSSAVSTTSLRFREDASSAVSSTFCRLFKARAKIFITEEAILFQPDFSKMRESKHEAIVFLTDSETAVKLSGQNSIAGLRSDRKVILTVLEGRIRFTKHNMPSYSSIMNIALSELAQISISGWQKNTFNMIRLEFANPKQQSSIHMVGDKAVILSLFCAISSWMVFYEVEQNASSKSDYTLNYSDITDSVSGSTYLQLYFRSRIAGISGEEISDNVLLLRDFVGVGAKASLYEAVADHCKIKTASPTSPSAEAELSEEGKSFRFVRQSTSPQGVGYFFANFRVNHPHELLHKVDCSMNGESGTASVSEKSFFFRSDRLQYVVPFSQILSVRLNNSLLAKSIKIQLSNNDTLTMASFKKGFRQPFFANLQATIQAFAKGGFSHS